MDYRNEENTLMNNKAYNLTILLSICHMTIDFLCAFSLYHSFSNNFEAFLLYNFCAFALQMPLGILIDYLSNKTNKTIKPGLMFMLMGVLLTITGSYLSNIILGIGNALFHVGAGVLVIHEDDDYGLNGKALGIFVAPGAIGLILGTLYNQISIYSTIQLIVSIIMILLSLLIIKTSKERQLVIRYKKFDTDRKDLIYIILLCFVVVILRSLTGMSISFDWKINNLISIISVIMIASGKSIGGLLSSKFGMKKTVVVTLLISSISYLLSNNMYFGLIALLFFNMTMPITLYLLSLNMNDMPGFAFGILTFGLFLGYLPVHYRYLYNMSNIFGSITSIISLVLLYLAINISNKDK